VNETADGKALHISGMDSVSGRQMACEATDLQWARSGVSLQDVPEPWNAPADNEIWVNADGGATGSFGPLLSMGPTQKRALAAAVCQMLAKVGVAGQEPDLRVDWGTATPGAAEGGCTAAAARDTSGAVRKTSAAVASDEAPTAMDADTAGAGGGEAWRKISAADADADAAANAADGVLAAMYADAVETAGRGGEQQ